MHALEVSILEAFKQEPTKTFSTTDLVRLIFREAYGDINRELHADDKRAVRKGFAAKGKLHRKLLYHVNSLVDQQLLCVAGTRGKGEKLFRLALEEGELVITEKRTRIVIAKPPAIATHIDGYEQQGLVRKYSPESWLHKQNSVLLDCAAFQGTTTLHQRLQTILPAVNDVIALHNVDALLAKAAPEDLERFVAAATLDASDFDVRLAFLFGASAVERPEEVLRLLRSLLAQDAGSSVVFAVTPKHLTRHDAFFRELLALFQERRVKITLRNASIAPAPLFFGRAGAYALTPQEWEEYKARIRDKADGCLVGQTSVAVDMGRVFAARSSPGALRELVLGTARALFEIGERKRRHHGAAYATLSPAKEFFRVGKDYVRFWNYDWAEDTYPIIDLLNSVQEEVTRFCGTEETIFRSCGLPVRFKVALSTSFAKFDQDAFSERRYTKTVVTSLKDLQTKEMAAYLRVRERLFATFQGSDRLRFFFARGTSVEETLQMARYLLRAYDLPSFTFDFRGKSGELKLSSFLEES